MRKKVIDNGKVTKTIHGVKILVDVNNKVHIADKKLKVFYIPMAVTDYATWSEQEPVPYKNGEFSLSNFRAMVWKQRLFYINSKGEKVTI